MEKITPVNRNKFYAAIKKILADGKNMTARECSIHLHRLGITETSARQESAPRLTEMLKMGMVEENGRKIDNKTHKLVTIYRLKEEN